MAQLAREKAELLFLDPESHEYLLRDASVTATVFSTDKWLYQLQISGGDRKLLDIAVEVNINPRFVLKNLTFKFDPQLDGIRSAWALRFQHQTRLQLFQQGLNRALYEHENGVSWDSLDNLGRALEMDKFVDHDMEDAEPLGDVVKLAEGEVEDDRVEGNPEENDEENDREQHSAGEQDDESDGSQHSTEENDREQYNAGEQVDESDRSHHSAEENDREQHSAEEEGETDTNSETDDSHSEHDLTNRSLVVGYKKDQSFVIRGRQIGVYKHTRRQARLSANISPTTPNGSPLSSVKAMLYNKEKNMILQPKHAPEKLYRMDIESGEVVEEWRPRGNTPVVAFAPETKFAQTNGKHGFLAISENSLYRIDPRQPGNRVAALKEYTSSMDFSALCTTEGGHIAVASAKGAIRLFKDIGSDATTLLCDVSNGKPIRALDVSVDGRWVLATCDTYLLLWDVRHPNGSAKSGFEKQFPAESKPRPRRLKVKPEHVATITWESNLGNVTLRPAKFNIAGGLVEVTRIVSSAGAYVIIWDMHRVLSGRRDSSTIKRLQDEIKGVDFRFGTDSGVLAALPNRVKLINIDSPGRRT